LSAAGPVVVAVAAGARHQFSKVVVPEIRLLAGLGVEGDAHEGVTVKHRSRVARDPSQPNLRQVHLLHAELFDELATLGFTLNAGDIGENILTRQIDLLGLPRGARLQVGDALLEVTGLRNPCKQLDNFRPGLMAVVVAGGVVRSGDPIGVAWPAERLVLEPV
jgi:hypothetical protein